MLLILAVLAGISIMAYRSYQHRRLVPEAARRVVAVLAMAREEAIRANQAHEAVVFIDEDTLWVDRGTSGSANFIPKIITPVALPEFVSITGVLKQGVNATTGVVTLPFNPDGTAISAAIGLVEDNDPAATATVKIYRTTGRAHTFINGL